MALLTLGTNATTSLQAFNFSRNPAHLADVATFNANVLGDLTTSPSGKGSIWPGAFRNGVLQVPNRGWLQILPGDFIAYDSTGWPILVSANAIANGPWTHS